MKSNKKFRNITKFKQQLEGMISRTFNAPIKITKKKSKKGKKGGPRLSTSLRPLYDIHCQAYQPPPTGFNKPVKITEKLQVFMKLSGNISSRTKVTKYICSYIKSNNLQDPQNKGCILPNQELIEILHPSYQTDNNWGLTFMTLQRYIKHHFIK